MAPKVMDIITGYCGRNPNMFKKFFNHNDFHEFNEDFKEDWVGVICKLMDMSEYGNHTLNENLESNLIYLVDMIIKSGNVNEINKLSIFYKRIRGSFGYGRGDCHYEYILDVMEDLEIRFLYLLRQ